MQCTCVLIVKRDSDNPVLPLLMVFFPVLYDSGRIELHHCDHRIDFFLNSEVLEFSSGYPMS